MTDWEEDSYGRSVGPVITDWEEDSYDRSGKTGTDMFIILKMRILCITAVYVGLHDHDNLVILFRAQHMNFRTASIRRQDLVCQIELK